MTTSKYDCQAIHELKLHKEQILATLSEQGYRITNQRRILIDIILNKECASCKEIYFQANQLDSSIGIATVYRMIKTLEEIGAIDRKNMYAIEQDQIVAWEKELVFVTKGNQTISLTMKELKSVMEDALRARGYLHMDEIEHVIIKK